eukprot:s774_g13.t1
MFAVEECMRANLSRINVQRVSKAQSPALQPKVYMRASEKLLNVFGQEMAKRRGLPPLRTSSTGELRPWDWMALLTTSERRIVELMRKKVRAVQSEVDDKPSIYLYNLSQTANFQPSPSPLQVWPALLRSSRYWVDTVHPGHVLRFDGRPMHPLEHMALQSLPVLLPDRTDPATVRTHFEKSLENSGASSANLFALAGNGMHVPSVGCMIAHGLMMTLWRL